MRIPVFGLRAGVLILLFLFLCVGTAYAEAYATYSPHGLNNMPYMRFYGGEISDPEYLASHIIYIQNDSDSNISNRVFYANQDAFVQYGNGWMFNNSYYTTFHQGSYNFSDKTTYFKSANSSVSMKFTCTAGQYAKFTNCSVISIDKMLANIGLFLDADITDSTFENFWGFSVNSRSTSMTPWNISNSTFQRNLTTYPVDYTIPNENINGTGTKNIVLSKRPLKSVISVTGSVGGVYNVSSVVIESSTVTLDRTTTLGEILSVSYIYTDSGDNEQLVMLLGTTINGGAAHDLTFKDIQGAFFHVENATNFSMYNISSSGAWMDDTGTGLYFAGAQHPNYYLTATGGHDNNAHDIYLDGVGRSGFDLSQYEYNFTGRNITVLRAGHNGFDLHGQWNVTLRDVTTGDSDDENFMIMSPNNVTGDHLIHNKTGAVDVRAVTTVSHDIYIYNLTVLNTIKPQITTGSDISWTRFVNVWLENATATNSTKFGLINYGENLTIINATVTNMISNEAITLGGGGTYGYINDTELVDCSFSSPTYNPQIYLMVSRNTSLINVYSDGGIKRDNGANNEHTLYYYLNIKAIDSDGVPVPGVVVSSNTSTRNGYGQPHASSVTDVNGKLYDGGNRSNWMAIPDYYRNDSGFIYYSPEISLNSGGSSLSYIVNNSDFWYTPNPAQPKYTITTIFNDSTDLHFTGYAPSIDENMYSEGDTVQFQIWANEPLTYVSWKKDGVVVQNSTSTTYQTVLTDAPVTVDITGASQTGTLSKSWVVDPTQTIDPDPDPGVLAPVANFTADVTTGTYPLKVSFTDTSTNTPTNWFWDLDNDGDTDRTTQNVVNYPYKAKGNYTVKLTVSNANNTDFETKTAYIQVTGTSPTRRTYWTNIADWFNNFYQMFTTGA